MFVLLLVALKTILAEARVYCEDVNATPWQALGVPCPVTCGTLHSAVLQLQTSDYENLIKTRNDIMNLTDPSNNLGDVNDIMLDRYTYKAYEKLSRSDNFNKDFRDQLTGFVETFNMTCYFKLNNNRLFREILEICTYPKATNGSKQYLLNGFKDFLNKYAYYDPFNEEMTLIILQCLMNNSEIWHGNVESILQKIKERLKPDLSEMSNIKKKTIYLTSKNCLSVYASGCFCKRGYVEESGQCLTPAECLRSLNFTKYLKRIIVT